jgi:hypothetical protein
MVQKEVLFWVHELMKQKREMGVLFQVEWHNICKKFFMVFWIGKYGRWILQENRYFVVIKVVTIHKNIVTFDFQMYIYEKINLDRSLLQMVNVYDRSFPISSFIFYYFSSTPTGFALDEMFYQHIYTLYW